MAAPFLSDTFTGSAGTALASHVGEIGATWVAHPNYPSSDAVITDANRMRPNQGASASVYYASGVPQSADYDVDLDIRVVSVPATGYIGVMGRVDTGSATYYWAIYNLAAGGWQLYRTATGTLTQLGTTVAETLTVGTTVALRLRLAGHVIKLLADGVEKISYTDTSGSAISAPGRAGLISYGAFTNSTGLHGDAMAASLARTLRTAGDSVTFGYNATNPSLRWPNKLAEYLGLPLWNLALPSSQIVDQTTTDRASDRNEIYLGDTVRTDDVWAWLTGYNDMRYFGTDANGLETYQRTLRAGVAWISRAYADCFQANHGGWAYTGTWTSASVCGLVTKYSNTSGDIAQISVTGTAVTVAWISRFGLDDGSTFTIKIDGATVATVDSNFGSDSGYQAGASLRSRYAPMALRFDGLAAGAHTVTLTLTSAGYTQVAFVTGNGEATQPKVMLGGPLKMTAGGYASSSPYNAGSDTAVANYAAAIQDVVADAVADGRDVTYIDVNLFYTPAADVDTDLIHPTNQGHAHIFDAFVSGLYVPISAALVAEIDDEEFDAAAAYVPDLAASLVGSIDDEEFDATAASFSGLVGSIDGLLDDEEADHPAAQDGSYTVDYPVTITISNGAVDVDYPVRIHLGEASDVEYPVRITLFDDATQGGLNGAGGWAAAPDGRWQATVLVGGVDRSSELLGAVIVRREHNAATIAEFDLRPAAPMAPLALIGKPVRIAFAQRGPNNEVLNAQLMFQGVVEQPEYVPASRSLHLVCTDQFQEAVRNTPRAWIDANIGGRFSAEVSGEPADNLDYALERLASVPKSMALNVMGSLTVIPWRDTSAVLRVTGADGLDGTPAVRLPSRSELVSRKVITAEYSYQVARNRGIVSQWQRPARWFINGPDNSGFPVDWLTVDMVEGALGSMDGWDLTSLSITHPVPGDYPQGIGVDAGVYTIKAEVAPDLAIGWNAKLATRWQQSRTEVYTLTVVAPNVEAMLGQPVSRETGVSVTAPDLPEAWAADATVTPRFAAALGAVDPDAIYAALIGDTNHVHEPEQDGETAWQKFTAAALAMIDRAKVELWAASRTGRIQFRLPCRPDIWLDRRIEVDVPGFHAEGDVVGVTHTLDSAAGTAITELTLAMGLPGNVGPAAPAWALPDRPDPDAVLTPGGGAGIGGVAARHTYYVGGLGSSPEFDEATMIGFATNSTRNNLAPDAEKNALNWYPLQLTIEAPEVPASDRDPLDIPVAQDYPWNVPTDLLEIA